MKICDTSGDHYGAIKKIWHSVLERSEAERHHGGNDFIYHDGNGPYGFMRKARGRERLVFSHTPKKKAATLAAEAVSEDKQHLQGPWERQPAPLSDLGSHAVVGPQRARRRALELSDPLHRGICNRTCTRGTQKSHENIPLYLT